MGISELLFSATPIRINELIASDTNPYAPFTAVALCENDDQQGEYWADPVLQISAQTAFALNLGEGVIEIVTLRNTDFPNQFKGSGYQEVFKLKKFDQLESVYQDLKNLSFEEMTSKYQSFADWKIERRNKEKQVEKFFREAITLLQEDIVLTNKLRELCELLGVRYMELDLVEQTVALAGKLFSKYFFDLTQENGEQKIQQIGWVQGCITNVIQQRAYQWKNR